MLLQSTMEATISPPSSHSSTAVADDDPRRREEASETSRWRRVSLMWPLRMNSGDISTAGEDGELCTLLVEVMFWLLFVFFCISQRRWVDTKSGDNL